MRWVDRLYRHPFEGASARRYARAERPAFGDLDDRLLDAIAPLLAGARTLLDVGCGPQTFAARAVARHPDLSVIALDPSRDFARRGAASVLRAAAEALPLATGSIDVATCVSSIRHVRDRARALGELRRVVRPGGRLVIVELDPAADALRIANHADRLGSCLLRHAFGPLVVKTAPRERDIARLASSHGWRAHTRHDDPVQPVYILELA
ncbi:MAG: class I SAM-dependent methyltransferase [Acidobacteriota bacterium]